MHTKDELAKIISLFKTQVENLLQTPIKVLQTDVGTKYNSILHVHPQISHQTTCPNTLQQNDTIQYKHRHIVELALAIMSHASIPLHFGDDIFQSVIFLVNCLPSSSPPLISPYTKLFYSTPDYHFLSTLGCLCYPFLHPYNDHKLQCRSLPCVFLGYSSTQKGYKYIHIAISRLYVSQHVLFDEKQCPFVTSIHP